MKAVFVTYDTDNDVGGVSSWLQRLLPRLQASGIDVEVHVLAFGGRPGLNCAGYEMHGIPFRWKPWEWDTRKAVRNCWKMIEESQPDVYVPNCILPAYYAASSVRRQGVATVGVLHSDDPFYWGIVDEFVHGRSKFQMSAVVAVSKFLQEALKQSEKADVIDIRQIGYGVPLPNQLAQPPNGVFRLVYTGRLVEEQKRISEVARAMCAVVKQNSGIEAWIVGEGWARAEVEQIIQTSGVDPRLVKLMGRVDVSKIYSVLTKCHAFVLLSEYEGLPVSMLEAMATGVVPICLDMRSGIQEAIQSGINGLIVKNRGEDFFSAVRNLSTDTAVWARLSANARQTVEERFSEEKCEVAWIELLRSFGVQQQRGRIRSPFFIRLPHRNHKFGHYDQRPSRLRHNWSQIRIKLRSLRCKILKPLFGAQLVK